MATGFALVGTGMISHFHAKAIGAIRGAKLVACFDNVPKYARAFAKQNDCTACDSIDDLLNHPAVDIVNICTPSGSHMDPAVAAANAGKHVAVEKPLEITLKRCDRIINACRKNGVKLCTILPSRFSPVNQELKSAIDSGRFGILTLGDTYVKWWRTQEYYDSGGWRGTWEMDGGGAYMNQAIHQVDLLSWMMGDVVEVTGMTTTLAHKRIEVEDVGVATLRFANGAVGVIEATTSAWPGLQKKTEIHGTRGTVIVEQDSLLQWEFEKKDRRDAAIRRRFAADSATSGGAADPKAISFQGHKDQLADFVSSIRNNTSPVVDGIEGRRSVEIILAIYKAAWSSKTVKLPLKSDPKPPRSK
jgi:UDP-N-acetyl-2-amino-2-deoxyglucuronate dehydrogenase